MPGDHVAQFIRDIFAQRELAAADHLIRARLCSNSFVPLGPAANAVLLDEATIEQAALDLVAGSRAAVSVRTNGKDDGGAAVR